MQEKEMISDYLAGINASLAGYGGIISQCENQELRETIQNMRNQDEVRQYALFKIAKEKGYYIPAQQATPEEVATVKQQVSQE
ncbi:spore coat protein [Clostridium perfringens]|uniref:spore coat protein n=1 Tax=Clostridium perfringens TaxID=1502 RepID=UPI000D714728|nr:spore coat protein [Clostridium perfringens]MBI6010097.1 spore coat protein [Clostridium perfringens]MDK0542179.1 spore coat protein [Clostridium perfringens]MDK0672120.1 spore coat protein [Clostridium perfringens]MDK0760945.1 spore coat protein [Clostridium perfringens]MDK0960366.1 spore coat protein [Clostridium perfringens]